MFLKNAFRVIDWHTFRVIDSFNWTSRAQQPLIYLYFCSDDKFPYYRMLKLSKAIVSKDLWLREDFWNADTWHSKFLVIIFKILGIFNIFIRVSLDVFAVISNVKMQEFDIKIQFMFIKYQFYSEKNKPFRCGTETRKQKSSDNRRISSVARILSLLKNDN